MNDFYDELIYGDLFRPESWEEPEWKSDYDVIFDFLKEPPEEKFKRTEISETSSVDCAFREYRNKLIFEQ